MNITEHIYYTYFNRYDCYAVQQSDGRYFCQKKEVSPDLIHNHIQGRITLGTYTLSDKSTAKYCVLDVDDNDTRKKMEENLKSLDIPAYMENSRRGGHLWFFFDQPIEGRLAKNFGEEIARRMDITCEVFPKQEVSKGPGSCIRLPFGIHRKTGKRYDFENFNDFKTEMKAMSHPSNRVNLDQVMLFQHEKIKSELKCYDNEPLWKKVKQAITVKELVENYVELNEHGVGKCPFHDDQTPSFSVNVEKNYWKCFRGCSGSSVIDFWMKLNKMEFSEAVKDLAERLRIQ